MFTPKAVFSGFSVDDLDKAKQFYTAVLGFKLEETMGGFRVLFPGGNEAWMYQKVNHQPAAYTMLNLMVDNIDEAVDELKSRGIVFEKYPDFPQDDKGITRGKDHNRGPDIAWFKDPSGNIISVLEV